MTVNNSLFVIAPYWDSGTWVFDDERVGLVREPFVLGVPDMIDHLVRDIPDAREGFRMIFSKTKYPGYGQSLSWRRTEDEGNWYQMDEEPLLSVRMLSCHYQQCGLTGYWYQLRRGC